MFSWLQFLNKYPISTVIDHLQCVFFISLIANRNVTFPIPTEAKYYKEIHIYQGLHPGLQKIGDKSIFLFSRLFNDIYPCWVGGETEDNNVALFHV
jgi:hypothetical protein